MPSVAVALVCLIHLAVVNSIVPQPVSIKFTNQSFLLPQRLQFITNAPRCFILNTAIERFLSVLQMKQPIPKTTIQPTAIMQLLSINIHTECDESNREKMYPSDSMIEQCKLTRVNVILRYRWCNEWSNFDWGKRSLGSFTCSNVCFAIGNFYWILWGTISNWACIFR